MKITYIYCIFIVIDEFYCLLKKQNKWSNPHTTHWPTVNVYHSPILQFFCLNTTFLSYVKIDWIVTAQPKLHDYKAVDVNQSFTF